jgi:hypothetical protein
MCSVLIVSNIRVFDEEGRATGPGLRAWGIAAALAARGHTATLLEPRPRGIVDSRNEREGVRLGWWQCGDPELRRQVATADLVVMQPGRVVAEALAGVRPRCLVVDLYNPVVTESLTLVQPGEPGVRQFGAMLRWYRYFLQHGDYFLCAGERQRLFTLGALAHAGRVNPLTDGEERLRLVPMGVESAPPGAPPAGPLLRGRAVPLDAELLIWPGGIYRWFEGVTAVRALARVRRERPRATLLFVGAENPLDPAASSEGVAETRAAARELGLLDAGVHFTPWLPYEARAAMYHEALVGVLTHRPLLEAQLSWRTRTLDCLWGGLPLVVTAGDEVGEIAERAGAAVCVPPEEPEALARVLQELLVDTTRRTAMAAAARQLAVDAWSWERVTEPLHQICLDPRPACDRAALSQLLGVGAAARLGRPSSLTRRIAGRIARSLKRNAPSPGLPPGGPASGATTSAMRQLREPAGGG